jgi:hypothetical protein
MAIVPTNVNAMVSFELTEPKLNAAVTLAPDGVNDTGVSGCRLDSLKTILEMVKYRGINKERRTSSPKELEVDSEKVTVSL